MKPTPRISDEVLALYANEVGLAVNCRHLIYEQPPMDIDTPTGKYRELADKIVAWAIIEHALANPPATAYLEAEGKLPDEIVQLLFSAAYCLRNFPCDRDSPLQQTRDSIAKVLANYNESDVAERLATLPSPPESV